MKQQVLQLINRLRIVAIVRLDDLSQAVSISRALAAGGILSQEYTLTNPHALRAVAEVKQVLRDEGYHAAIGVGSVRQTSEAHSAIDAGADFIVSPITRSDIIEVCTRADVAVMPGAYTPTEIAHAWECGADVVKVFPARNLGPGYIKDVLAPMPYLKLMPTGGVDLQNLQSFFAAGAVAAGIGGNLIDARAIAEGRWDAVTQVARSYSQCAAQSSN